MWTVTCDYIRGALTYFVEHRITGERKGTFDCEQWANEMADELNREGIDGIKRTDRKDLEII